MAENVKHNGGKRNKQKKMSFHSDALQASFFSTQFDVISFICIHYYYYYRHCQLVVCIANE